MRPMALATLLSLCIISAMKKASTMEISIARMESSIVTPTPPRTTGCSMNWATTPHSMFGLPAWEATNIARSVIAISAVAICPYFVRCLARTGPSWLGGSSPGCRT
ncbi:hypothetical protein D9M70_538350 [compost metagenome]